jgi:hypothetical protein
LILTEAILAVRPSNNKTINVTIIPSYTAPSLLNIITLTYEKEAAMKKDLKRITEELLLMPPVGDKLG